MALKSLEGVRLQSEVESFPDNARWFPWHAFIKQGDQEVAFVGSSRLNLELFAEMNDIEYLRKPAKRELVLDSGHGDMRPQRS
ncbi:MAG TPA: hypothetical protein VLH19_05435 [Patescibacteria group bacterium]|nr:hypothetical protein [Patescibacteria group bacterium]